MDSSEEHKNWIKRKSFKRVCLQFPDESKIHSLEAALDLEKSTNSQVFLIDESSCGTCCTNKHISSYMQADACIHYGHACLSKNSLPTYHIFSHKNLDIESFIKNFQVYFKEKTKNIILFYDASFQHIIDKVSDELQKYHENFVVSLLSSDSTTDPSHSKTLGRSYELPVDHRPEMYEAVFLGDSEKILMILSMSTKFKKWHYFDGNEFCNFSVSSTFWFKKRSYLIEKIRDSHTFGLVVASLNISDYMNIVKYLKFILKKLKKKTYLFCIEKIEPTKLANFQEVDIFVAIGCPENSIFSSKDFFKPLVTPYDVELAFNESREFSEFHAIDFKEILPGGCYHINFEKITNSDVSLLSGKLRNENENEINLEENHSLVQKSYGELQDIQTGSKFLQSRLWKGLELKLGENNVIPIEEGRSGLPVNYKNEV